MTSLYALLISLLFILTISVISAADQIDTTLSYEEESESSQSEDFKDEAEKGEIQPLLEIASSFESQKQVPKPTDDKTEARDSHYKPPYGGSHNKPYKDDPPKYDSFGSSYSHYGGSFYIPPKEEHKPPKQGSYQKPTVELPKPPKQGGYGDSFFKPAKDDPKPPKESYIGSYKPPNQEPKPYKPYKEEQKPYSPPKEIPKPPKNGYEGAFYKPPKEEFYSNHKDDFHYPNKEQHHSNHKDEHHYPPNKNPYPYKDERPYPHKEEHYYPKPDHFKPPKEEFYRPKPTYDSPFSKPLEHYPKPLEPYPKPDEINQGYYPDKEIVFSDAPFRHLEEDYQKDQGFQPIPILSKYKSNEEHSQPVKRQQQDAFKAIEDKYDIVKVKAPSANVDIRADSVPSLESIIDEVFGSATAALFEENIIETTTQEAVFVESTTLLTQKKFVPFKGAGCSGHKMECVPYYLCKNGTINRKGGGVVDIRLGEEDKEPECPFLEECCSLSSKTKTPIIKIPPKHEGCGYRNSEGVGFKISGARDHESEFGEFPWMVALIKQSIILYEEKSIFQCGASVINPKVVLTAAHCVRNVNIKELRARAGEWDTQTIAEVVPYQDREIDGIVIHKYYSEEAGLVNDIALLFLKTPFELAENVNPVCLPPKHFKFDYSKCFATGWGKDSFAKEGRYSTILKKIELPVVPNDKCEDMLRTTRLGKYFELDDSFMCAGGEPGVDTCQGDGGSPLVCPIEGHKNRYYQAGIVAWGIGCNDPIPGVYANVAYLRQWVDEQLNLRGIESSHYTLL